jgi:hypothetical protein
MLAALALASVLVHNGDTLSGIAQEHGLSVAAVEAANPQISNPNVISVGESVSLNGSGSYSPSPSHVASSSAPATSVSVGHTSGSGYEGCVISHESGGNSHAVNPSSGAGGLYQFLPSTWASLGYSGSPQDAPVSEQNAAFQKLHSEMGSSPWETDGC